MPDGTEPLAKATLTFYLKDLVAFYWGRFHKNAQGRHHWYEFENYKSLRSQSHGTGTNELTCFVFRRLSTNCTKTMQRVTGELLISVINVPKNHYYFALVFRRMPYPNHMRIHLLHIPGFCQWQHSCVLLSIITYCLRQFNSKHILMTYHDVVIKWKHFPRYWPFVRGIQLSLVNFPHKGQWRGDLIFSLMCAWKNVWVNSHEACDLRRYCAHYDVPVMN